VPDGRRATGLRPEIQALRAVAVLAVVTNHVWPHTVTGGYVGVDVFFVISGFLITGHLLREVDAGGRIRLAAFWARRARRLLPASLLVLLTTLVLSMALLPETLWGTVLRQVGASALYVQNWALAADSVDYFASQQQASPVTHFWSLSAEEQFYLVWPLLIAAVAVALHGRSTAWRAVLATGLGLLVAASFALSLVLTSTHPSEAYFVTPTRAWEFGAGGLLAVLGHPSAEQASRRRVASWLGWGAIACSVLAYSETTRFPGLPAAVPVIGTVLVIWAGTTRAPWSPVGLVSLRPVQAVGDVSYSLYLWHWPVIVLTPYALGGPPGTGTSVVLVGVSLLLAWLTRTLVEEPARTWRGFAGARPRRSLVLAAAGSAVVLLATTGGHALLQHRTEASEARLQAALRADSGCLGAAAFATPGVCGTSMSSEVVPAPAIARTDTADAFECYTEPSEPVAAACRVQDPERPQRRVALVGDSHAALVSVPLREIAARHGWQLDVYLRSACPLTTAAVFFDEAYVEPCADHRERLLHELTAAGRYDTVIVTGWSGLRVDRTDLPEDERVTRLAAGYRDAWRRISAAGPQVVVVADNPAVPEAYADCVVEHGVDASTRCVIPRAAALGDDPLRTAAEAIGAPVVDLTDLYCDAEGCPMVVGGVLVHFDLHHITATFARTLTPYLDDRLTAVTG
jgi:peptidoglycan/LPS O-acetylase OafA/YrhL